MYDARKKQWNDRAGVDAGFTISYSTSSFNRVGWAEPSEIGGAIARATPGCDSDSSSCRIWVNDDTNWYTASTGQLQTSSQQHLAGVLSHELGHWFAQNDCSSPPRQGPPPDNELKTMCFGDPGWTNRHQQYTISQDEIAGVRYAYDKSKTSASGGYNRFSINDDFNRCAGGNPSGAACVPDYFTIYADSNRYWWWKSGSDGFMSINNGNIAYPEIIYHAWGSTVDVDNDETFYVSAYVKAWDQDPGSTRAVLFARWEDGTHEVKCDNYPSGLPIGQWTWISCLFATEDSPSDDKWEFGIRVTDKVDIDYIWVDDA
jgi:hypothetical protein